MLSSWQSHSSNQHILNARLNKEQIIMGWWIYFLCHSVSVLICLTSLSMSLSLSFVLFFLCLSHFFHASFVDTLAVHRKGHSTVLLWDLNSCRFRMTQTPVTVQSLRIWFLLIKAWVVIIHSKEMFYESW